MTIKKRSPRRKPEIDISGPAGNAFVILGHAKNLAKQLGKDWPSIQMRMTAGSYEQLISVFDKEFGDHVDLVR